MPEMENPSNPPKIILDYASPATYENGQRWLGWLIMFAGLGVFLTTPLLLILWAGGNFLFGITVSLLPLWIICLSSWTLYWLVLLCARLAWRPAKPPGLWLTALTAIASLWLIIGVPLWGFPWRENYRNETLTVDGLPLLLLIAGGSLWAIQSLRWHVSRWSFAGQVFPASRWRFYHVPLCILILVGSLAINLKLRGAFLLSYPWMNAVAGQSITMRKNLPDRQIGLFNASGIGPIGVDMAFSVNHTDGGTFYYSANGNSPFIFRRFQRMDNHWYYCEPGE